MPNLSNDTDTTRRRLLKGMSAAGAASAVGLAGCAGVDDDGEPMADSEALQLIQEGFEEEGIEPPYETTIITNADNDDRVQWVGLIQEVLDGTPFFDIEQENFEWGAYIERILSPEFAEENEAYAVGLAAGFDPDSYVRATMHPDRQGACCNGHGFSDPELTDLIEDGRHDPDVFLDEETRISHYGDLERLALRLSGISFIDFGRENDVYDPDILGGWETYPSPSFKIIMGTYAPEAGVSASVSRDSNELVVGLAENVNNFDPVNIDDTTSAAAVRTLVYEALVRYDFDGDIQPLLAEDWEQLDETTVRYHLRDAEFHNGEELVADMVKRSWERYEGTPREPDVYDWYEGSEIVDESTLEVYLQEPDALAIPSAAAPAIMPYAILDEEVDPTETPIGTAAYQFEEFRDDDLYRVESFEDHWFEGDGQVPAEPEIERITCQIIREDSTRTAALLDGDVDLTYALTADDNREFMDERDDFVVDNVVNEVYDYVGWPVEHGPFQNAKVRRGVNALLPREIITEEVFQGLRDPAYTPISPMTGDFYDEQRVQQLIEEELPDHQ